MMVQCDVTRGTKRTVAWLPEALAVAGKWLKIRGENGWRVACAYPKTKLSVAYVREHQRIDLPSIV